MLYGPPKSPMADHIQAWMGITDRSKDAIICQVRFSPYFLLISPTYG
jgi:hypothetical protein